MKKNRYLESIPSVDFGLLLLKEISLQAKEVVIKLKNSKAY